jgi:signal transduction histidine kinase
VSGVLPVREGDYEFVHLLDIFDRNVRRLADVAARLERLSHASVEDAFVPLHHRVNLSRVVQGVADTLSDMARARGVRIEITGPLPVLDADAARIEMIFLNLMANAIKYSDPGKPERRVQVMEVPDAARPTVIVRDNGIGIPARHVQHIFREFVRAHAQRDRELGTSGLGIGLSIVRDSMDASGGEVRLESIEGVGTTVTLSWPVGRRRG